MVHSNPVHKRPEEFENGGPPLKAHMFSAHITQEEYKTQRTSAILKLGQENHVIIARSSQPRSRGRSSYMRDPGNEVKVISVLKMSSVHTKTKKWRSQISPG